MTYPLVTFMLGDQSFGLDIGAVDSIVRMVAITPLPDSAPGILGAIIVHGTPTLVLDLRQRYGLPHRAPRDDSPLLLVRIQDNSQDKIHNKLLAVLVDRVAGVGYAESREPGPVRLGDRLSIILDANQLLIERDLPLLKTPENVERSV